MEYISNSPEDTKKFARKFAKKLAPGACLCLMGELGSGKTTFVQGLAAGLGVKKRIISPTFVLAREYPREKFAHMDMYRISRKEFAACGINQYLDGKWICAVEWADKIEDYWPGGFIAINFEMTGSKKRKITIKQKPCHSRMP